MSITSLKDIIDAEVNNGYIQSTFRKVPSQVSVSNVWYDLSLAPGTPAPKYWFDASPLVAQRVKQSTDGGLFHGASPAPLKKYARQFTYFQNGATSSAYYYKMIVCDYLLYYPSVDESITDEQFTDNTNTLTRYTDGVGVQVMAVNLAARTGGQTFTFTYTNQDGVSGRISQPARLNAYPSIGMIATSDMAQANSMSPFIGLQSGDTGVRSIESITMNGVDVGLFALILVKPLFSINQGITSIGTTWIQLYEKDLLEGNQLPEIQDDAYINIITNMSNTAMNTFAHMGSLKTIIA